MAESHNPVLTLVLPRRDSQAHGFLCEKTWKRPLWFSAKGPVIRKLFVIALLVFVANPAYAADDEHWVKRRRIAQQNLACSMTSRSGPRIGGNIAKSSGAFFFIWTIIALGVTAFFSVILLLRGLKWRLR